MNDLQTLFTIVFGIYFATTVATSGRFSPFDSTAAVAGDRRALLRLLLAFAILNIVPFAYFIWALHRLQFESGTLAGSPWKAAGVFMAGLAGFGIYRLFLAIVLVRRPGNSDRFVFFSHPDDLKSPDLKEGARHKQPPLDAMAYAPTTIAIGGVLWLGACLLSFCILA